MAGEADRRMFERIAVNFPVRIKDNTCDKAATGFCVDISASGAGIFCRQNCGLNDKLDLWVELPDRYNPLQLSGEVVWIKEVQPQAWRVGIQFSRAHFMDLATVMRMAQS